MMKTVILVLTFICSSQAKPASETCNNIARGITEDDVDPFIVNECRTCEEYVQLEGKISSAPQDVPPELEAFAADLQMGDEITFEMVEVQTVSSIKLWGEQDSAAQDAKLHIFFKLPESGSFVPINDADENPLEFDAKVGEDVELPVYVETTAIRVKVLNSETSSSGFRMEVFGCGEEEEVMNDDVQNAEGQHMPNNPISQIMEILFKWFSKKNPIECKEKCRKYVPNTCECAETKEGDLYEGDIYITNQVGQGLDLVYGITDNSNNRQNRHQRGATRVLPLWTNYKRGTRYEIPYTLDSSLDSAARNAIQAAISELSQKTCIDLVKGNDRERIHFFRGGGCFSPVAKQVYRPPNRVSIGQGCQHKGIVVHEILHSLGFWHEQSRPDRDDYVDIIWNNIIPRMKYNFQKQEKGAVDSRGSRYDIKSLMHYGGTAFGNGRMTIRDKSTGRAVQAQRNGLSTEDVKQLNSMYPCSASPGPGPQPPKPNCKDGASNCSDYKNYCWHNIVKKYCKNTCNLC